MTQQAQHTCWSGITTTTGGGYGFTAAAAFCGRGRLARRSSASGQVWSKWTGHSRVCLGVSNVQGLDAGQLSQHRHSRTALAGHGARC